MFSENLIWFVLILVIFMKYHQYHERMSIPCQRTVEVPLDPSSWLPTARVGAGSRSTRLHAAG